MEAVEELFRGLRGTSLIRWKAAWHNKDSNWRVADSSIAFAVPRADFFNSLTDFRYARGKSAV
jgi:hypothetical protein